MDYKKEVRNLAAYHGIWENFHEIEEKGNKRVIYKPENDNGITIVHEYNSEDNEDYDSLWKEMYMSVTSMGFKHIQDVDYLNRFMNKLKKGK